MKYLLFIPEGYNTDRDHYILDVYEDPELYSWFLQHQLNDGLSGSGSK